MASRMACPSPGSGQGCRYQLISPGWAWPRRSWMSWSGRPASPSSEAYARRSRWKVVPGGMPGADRIRGRQVRSRQFAGCRGGCGRGSGRRPPTSAARTRRPAAPSPGSGVNPVREGEDLRRGQRVDGRRRGGGKLDPVARRAGQQPVIDRVVQHRLEHRTVGVLDGGRRQPECCQCVDPALIPGRPAPSPQQGRRFSRRPWLAQFRLLRRHLSAAQAAACAGIAGTRQARIFMQPDAP